MHEKKSCPKCGGDFECKAGTITQCQCYAVRLSMEEKNYVEERFADCLCISCLLGIKNEYVRYKNKFIFWKMVNNR